MLDLLIQLSLVRSYYRTSRACAISNGTVGIASDRTRLLDRYLRVLNILRTRILMQSAIRAIRLETGRRSGS